ncbi:GDSL esterase/lipase APG-like [Lolium rigidum]|uniref:GDSL esterase/lipase APG-like n=1 Tax=Lolium rigidum TaxID=89674 RepID=UPI001F5CE8E4|nr:GDSL esterase/lipase APG-like [Lolium rigidum]
MAVRHLLLLLAIFLVSLAGMTAQGGETWPRVPALMVFGDSLVDVGNNDYITSVVKANSPPYGRDFKDHVATGRFSNGRLLSDIIGEKVGFSGSPPAYLSPQASGQNLLIGANFASAGGGYYDPTAFMYHVISLSKQLEYFKDYTTKLAAVAGSSRAQSIVSNSVYIISAGSTDFGLSYYINPLLFKTLTAAQFSDRLIGIFNKTVTQLYGMGARRIGVFSLPPFGCLPLAITVFGHGSNECVPRLNNDFGRYNMMLSAAVESLSNRHHDLKIVVLDIYKPLYNLATSPEAQGFSEARRACCGTGTVETTVLLCNTKSVGTCSNATTYVFWDSVHPSEAANEVIVDSLNKDINRLVI